MEDCEPTRRLSVVCSCFGEAKVMILLFLGITHYGANFVGSVFICTLILVHSCFTEAHAGAFFTGGQLEGELVLVAVMAPLLLGYIF